MSPMKLSASATALLALSAASALAQSREEIRIVGSSTVFPYTQAVAEQFASATGAPSPIVESTGTGGGFQAFCGGVGEQHPDITGASRAIKASEFELCQQNGVTEITEALIGYDGLSIAMSQENPHDWDLSLQDIYLALGAQVPVDGEWVDNPYQTWSEVNPELPDQPILVYGPPPTSGTRDAFVELAMLAGCEELDHVKEGGFDEDWIEENCSRMRTDGPFVEAGENDNLIVQRLTSDPNAMGIFGYSFLFENQDTLKGAKINGVEANLETIASFEYPISRPLYIYVKDAHRGVIPNLQEFIDEYMSEEALAGEGYLAERGLVSLPDEELATMQEAVIAGTAMQAPAE